jgi:DNA-directed RNA polymerase specialized sigma24 family protein
MDAAVNPSRDCRVYMGVELQALKSLRPEEQTAADLTDVVRAHQRSALRLAYLLTGDKGQAEELVADAFALMYARWQRDRIDDPRAYLRRAVVNQARGRFRRTAIRPEHEARNPRSDPTSSPADERSADRERLRCALLELLGRCSNQEHQVGRLLRILTTPPAKQKPPPRRQRQLRSASAPRTSTTSSSSTSLTLRPNDLANPVRHRTHHRHEDVEGVGSTAPPRTNGRSAPSRTVSRAWP